MFVCLCAAVREKDIIDAINNGAKTERDVKKITGACKDCCGCKVLFKSIYKKYQNGEKL